MIRHANFQLFRVHPDGLTPLRNGFLITFEKMQKQPPEVFYKKAILENFAILTGKHLCWSFFLILNIAVSKSTYFQNIHERLLLKMCSWKEKTLHKKKGFFNINIRNKWKCICLVISWLVSFEVRLDLHAMFLFDMVKKCLLELMKRRSKVQNKNMSCERALNFGK